MKYFMHEIEDSGGLRKEIWRYWFDSEEMQLVLDTYAVAERPNKRHNFQTVRQWGRREHWIQNMDIKDVPVRDDVRAEVLRQFVARVTVAR
jgi:hypothetical protein